ncbi:hypothetical protein QCN27_17995 [Cereibacter sp. SYSU M97828]|nr:hypothetical protein [Cereibacter flavus]
MTNMAAGHKVRPLYTHPNPAAAPTDNTALVEDAMRTALLWKLTSVGHDATNPAIIAMVDKDLKTLLSSRPGEATSREGVGDMPDCIFAHPDKEWTFHKGISHGVEYIRSDLTTKSINENATSGRFDPLWSFHEMLECSEGAYVRTSDHEALQAKLAEVEAERDNLKNWVDHHATEVPRLQSQLLFQKFMLSSAVELFETELKALQAQVTEARAAGFLECRDKAAELARRYLYCTKGLAEQTIRRLTPTVSDAAQEGDKG